MKLSISNIGWSEDNDIAVYEIMKSEGFEGLEIAPTRIFKDTPYDRLDEAKKWAEEIKDRKGFVVPSMQSIWYGRNGKLFGTEEERQALLEYTKKAIDFAETIGCNNLVFGCPRNRYKPEGVDEDIAIDFFRTVGKYAAEHNTVIGMEANPAMYNTNYINYTEEAFELIEKIGSNGFKLNLDVGTMIANEEDVSILNGREHLINHVHISEPGLKPIESRQLHREIFEILINSGYDGFVSIEVGKQEKVDDLCIMMEYVKRVFGVK